MIVVDGKGRYRVDGPMTLDHVAALLDQGHTVFAPDGPIEVDLGTVGEVDSSACALLLEWLRHARSRGQEIQYRNPPANLATLASLYGLSSHLPLLDPRAAGTPAP
ncbi:MAG: STAS domain-containing protein [Betaproteobacteria bacterium]|nr:STAS domain-containing protein [Betaproteobacteria bacterium]